ncbi:hypothetical protein AB1K70_26505, partial [Bremerella sp. JC770]|uniref:hypothetical protein n=1 Tax=Bremerella sp. JC770 TaxID=3232137 RepID=UPI0034597F10
YRTVDPVVAGSIPVGLAFKSEMAVVRQLTTAIFYALNYLQFDEITGPLARGRTAQLSAHAAAMGRIC